MTIIKNTRGIQDYPLKRVDPDLSEAFVDVWRTDSKYLTDSMGEVILRCIDCYCELTNQSLTLSVDGIPSQEFGEVLYGFFNLMKGKSLVDFSAPYKKRLLRETKTALCQICESHQLKTPPWLLDMHWGIFEPQNLDESQFDNATLYHWGSWPIHSRKGQQQFMHLSPLVKSHGKEFSLSYYNRWKSFYAKQARSSTTDAREFALYLSQNSSRWPPSTFKNPIKIASLFNEYLKEFFLKSVAKNLDLKSTGKRWNLFVANVDEAFFQPAVWPEPFGKGIPKIKIPDTVGARTKVSKNDSGVEVHNKLLTEVPLYYSDEQTIEILFREIEGDLNAVERWAERKASSLAKRQKERLRLAEQGTPYSYDTLGYYPRAFDEIDFADICASFEADGFDYKLENKDSVLGALPRKELAHKLGLPRTMTLFPFMALLVIDDPRITSSFLSEFDLYDKHGQLDGFTKTGDGYQLKGYKDRRKSKRAEQKIALKPRSAALVKDVIAITQPLRDYLKNEGDDRWRKLFLTCGFGFNYPTVSTALPFGSGKQDRLTLESAFFKNAEIEFEDLTNKKCKDLLNFLHKFSISAIRSSAGVAVYLRTQSVKKMAEALGHAQYDGNLLSHYLPESILAFFQTRWIRIFQRAFVCEALKDSPFLLEAANFESMEELHKFLSNHALKDIPEHLSDPEQTKAIEKSTNSNDQVLISIDAGILAALISLSHAVENANNQKSISGLARYWSSIANLIEKEISNGTDALLKNHLSVAKNSINPQKMEPLIYEPAG